ncbi:hypothetical protein NT01EI_0123 [Edwardsiella ictaluri 93-146]|uniref:Uncharacterized protein n=1 Tax=Edwardsiella ictaluri (strain 93-146) TaxID=634503 RepID=C5BC87_EDWI9|nr:hypothetical protein NT01EI_0123 [Edwardsiella ictaluri 93-146]
MASVFALPVMRRGYRHMARWIDRAAVMLLTAARSAPDPEP